MNDRIPARLTFGAHALCAILMFSGCVPHGKRNAETVSHPGEEPAVILRNLSYHDGILEGEVFNRSKKIAGTVLIEVIFSDSSGKRLFAQDFKAVPGGDGRALLPEYVKHFNYKLALAGPAKIAVAGKVKSVDYR